MVVVRYISATPRLAIQYGSSIGGGVLIAITILSLPNSLAWYLFQSFKIALDRSLTLSTQAAEYCVGVDGARVGFDKLLRTLSHLLRRLALESLRLQGEHNVLEYLASARRNGWVVAAW
jgi:hypothetical protein